MTGITVTATQGGSTGNGTFLQVLVLDNAAVGSSPNSASAVFGSNTTPYLDFTPQNSGSLAYAIAAGNSMTFSSGVNTLADDGGLSVEFQTYVSSAPGQQVTIGDPNPSNPGTYGPNQIAIVEVQQSGGSILTDPSTPAVVYNGSSTSATTASFTPPAGALILVLAGGAGGSGTTTLNVTSSLLTFTQILSVPQSGDGVAAIWYAVMPPAPQIVTTQTPGGVIGEAYNFTFTGTSGTKPYSWAVTSGALPSGLSLSSAGVVSGTPTASVGVYSFTVTLTDAFTFTASASFAIVINANSTPGGVVRATWALSAFQYSYGCLPIEVSTVDHDWIFVTVSWSSGDDTGIAYCADNVHNFYQPSPFASSPQVNTQTFVVPNARAVSTIYISTSAYVRWLNVQVTEVTGLDAGYVVDASSTWTGGPSTSFTESLSTANADFIFAVGALSGTPQTVGQAGSGATWTALTGSINGSSSAGVTQSVAWAETTGAASPSMTFSGVSSYYAGVMIAVRQAGGLPANINPAWPVIKAQAAFGYTPQQPTAPPVWTDITGRFRGLNGDRGRSFELDENSAADMTAIFDNFDGALSPQNTASPYYPNVTLITPVQVTATWQGREYSLFRGLLTSIPQTFDFQRGLVKATVSDDWSKLPNILLAPCMIQEMLYDQPLAIWPLNDQQGAPYASNWSGISAAELIPTVAQGGGGATPAKELTVSLFGQTFSVASSFLTASTGTTTSTGSTTGSTSNTPTTGFGNTQSGTYPGGLAGTTDSVWGNTSAAVGGGSTYQGTVLVDSNDTTLPLTATGATYSVWAQMYSGLNSSTGAMVMLLTNQAGSGSAKYLGVYYNGTTVTVSQTSGSQVYTPTASLFDSKWHLWTVTITTAGVITLYIDTVQIGSFTGSFPSGSPTLLQWGGDTTVTSTSSAGLWTGCMYLAAVYPRVIDFERMQTWYQSGTTGFLDELAGTRLQRVLAWARWSAPQQIDPGLSKQQAFNYLTGGYGSSGLTGAIGNYATAGGSAAVDFGAQADVTMQDIANTENGLLCMSAQGGVIFHERDDLSSYPVGHNLGDMDYALNPTSSFSYGLGEWTNTTSCTVAISNGWSFCQEQSALITVTGTPSSASVAGSQVAASGGEETGFSTWMMSPQGCYASIAVNWYGYGDLYSGTYTASYPSLTFGQLGSNSSATVQVPPMTPVFLNVPAVAAPAGTTYFQAVVTIQDSPATGTQLYFDRPRVSPAGFQVPYEGENEGDLQVTEDIQYLFNDVAITRNVDQATYRTINQASRSQYYPRVYTRTIYSSVDDPNAVVNCGNTLLNAFALPQLRVEQVIVDAASNPDAWEFVLEADIGDLVSFTRTPVGGAVVTGSFLVLSISLALAPDKAEFTYVLCPVGVF